MRKTNGERQIDYRMGNKTKKDKEKASRVERKGSESANSREEMIEGVKKKRAGECRGRFRIQLRGAKRLGIRFSRWRERWNVLE
jgi:hypothetical protein